MRSKRTGKIEYDLTHTQKKFTRKALVVAFKITQNFLPFFPDFISVLFSRLFPGLENCWANFKPFTRIQDSVRTLLTHLRKGFCEGFSLRSRRFRLLSEQKKKRGMGFSVLTAREMKRKPKNERGGRWSLCTPPRSFTCTIFRVVFESCSSFFAPKPHGNACYAG